jgi:hypothetical protein
MSTNEDHILGHAIPRRKRISLLLAGLLLLSACGSDATTSTDAFPSGSSTLPNAPTYELKPAYNFLRQYNEVDAMLSVASSKVTLDQPLGFEIRFDCPGQGDFLYNPFFS